MSELDAQLTDEQYRRLRREIARETLVTLVATDESPDDADAVYDACSGDLYRAHPISILTHAEMTVGDVAAASGPASEPVDNEEVIELVEHRARAVLAADVATEFDDIIAAGDVVVRDDETGTLRLTSDGDELLGLLPDAPSPMA